MSTLSLNKLDGYNDFDGPVVMVVMDGVGIGALDETDGVHLANSPVLDALLKEPVYTQLKAHGDAVGLPSEEDMGNSEVGHNALGAGRVFSQGAKLVNEALASKQMYEGHAWKDALGRAQAGGTMHFIGLLSDGNVHSHIDQLIQMIEQCAADGVERVRVHILTDGRDVKKRSALTFIEPLEAALAATGKDYKIGSGGGRMIVTMDRYEANWAIVERGWTTHVLGEGRAFASAAEAVQTYYDEDPEVGDQFLGEFVIVEDGKPIGTVEDGDAVIFFNFRGDRSIEISQAFEQEDFPYFDRKRVPDVFYAGLMQYDGDKHIPKNFLVEPPQIERTLGEYLCAEGVTSYAISETQKFGHVTYFWNGNKSGYIDASLEKYEEIRSDDVPFEQRPWMKCAEITDAVIAALQSKEYKFLRLNYANGDMVGHTGIADAVRIAVEAVDLMLARLLPVIEALGGIVVITADHGNADQLFTVKGDKKEPHMAHTLNPVPFIVKDYNGANAISLNPVDKPGLSNAAATVMNLLGYEAPEDYDASLIKIG